MDQSQHFHKQLRFPLFYFQLKSPPVLSGPILQDNRSFIFQCNVNDNSSIPGQAIEVVWTFDGQQDTSLPSQIISGDNQSAVLDGAHLKGHLNTQVGKFVVACR